MRVGAGDRLGPAGWDEPGRESVLRPVKVYARWSWPGGICVAEAGDKRMKQSESEARGATLWDSLAKEDKRRARRVPRWRR